MIDKIRNFSIIAHIDHGKSTLADRMLEITETVDKRQMKEQILDDMELERERGITIKMRPVRMNFGYKNDQYILNLIDTPGHIDFSYEVSRALKAVEGTVLLVDSTQGVQAQTLTTLEMAKDLGLKIIPVLSKIDSPLSRIDEVKKEIVQLINCSPEDILLTSGKTGEGVKELLQNIIEKIPAPKTTSENQNDFRSLIFDFQYSNHRGIIVYTRVFDGFICAKDQTKFVASNRNFITPEVGVFVPQEKTVSKLSAGEIGYVVTGIKEPGIANVGDTLLSLKTTFPALSGYKEPRPVVWASIFPESQDDFTDLKSALSKLKLTDSSLTYEEETSGIAGRGFRCGFLGMLHLEIITERLRREFNLELVVTLPSITYKIKTRRGEDVMAYSAISFPEFGDIDKVDEPWVNIQIILPNQYLGEIMSMLYEHEVTIFETDNWGNNRSSIKGEMPLRELMRNFFDDLKSCSSGYASLSYELSDYRSADVVKLEILVAEEEVPAFSRIVARHRVQEEAEKSVEKLYNILPRQMFTMKIQAKALGRIISSKTISALRKNVTQHMYGGDITRKMKLRDKQKKGKKKMQALGKVNIGQDVFLKMMRNE
ncbi:MAG TPA: translation elongation factor 4 [Candidatus Paceibacterota bacterium]|nr:translation elongation factor 4 [Candidatus Paceibacterota bacterium]HMP19248.1 translation elongation factor 4 [Candidatus Paceibacterota bacterium]HMP85537.1 translation elongation factor 4 [Candidatus Paceibacterota bacterium]